MRITLIKPRIGRKEFGPYIDEGRMEPLQMGVLAGMIPEDIDVSFYDDRMEEVNFDEPTDLVAVTVESFTARRAYEIGKEYKKRGVPVVMGGTHPTLIPGEVAHYAPKHGAHDKPLHYWRRAQMCAGHFELLEA